MCAELELIEIFITQSYYYFYLLILYRTFNPGRLFGLGKLELKLDLIEFHNDNYEVHFCFDENSMILLGHSPPLNEPIVARGPFVMNTEEEIAVAYNDYCYAKLGDWDQ